MELLSVTMNDGVKPRSEIEGKDNSSEDKSNYKIVRKGDMVYNSMRMWQGANGISPCDGIVSPAYTVLMPKQEINNGYFAALFKSVTLINEFRKNSQGMTSDTWNLKYPQIETIKVQIPSVSEQDKVSELFSVLDERIATQAQLVESLKKYKRGLSNSLFDRLSAGSESRLCIFGDMMTILQNNTFSRDNLSVGDNGVRNIHYGDVLIKYGAVLDLHSENVPVINAEQDISKFSALSYLRNGDVVFADTAEDYTVGKSTEIIGAENIAALSGLHTIPCRPQDSFVPMYLGYYFNSDYFKKQLYPMIQGTKVSSISKSEIIKTKIIVPCLQEQARIASIMSALDDRIDAAKHTTKDLIDLRSGLLQQLFI